MIASGVVTAEETPAWAAARERLAAMPEAEFWFGVFTAIGRKPAGE
jgi:hypothetical protein